MKKIVLILALVVMFLVPMGLSGCGTKQNTPAPTATEQEKKEASSTDKPAADKPKDHPAH